MMNWGMTWPTKTYPVIVADPPWNFKVFSSKGEGRSATNHYPCMSRKDIAELPVSSLLQDRSVVFLWTTPQDMDFAIDTVMPAWGLTYKTDAFIWLKTKKYLEKVLAKAFKQWKKTGVMPDPIEFLHSMFVTTKGYYSRKQAEICLLGTTKKILPRASKGVKELIIAPRREHSRKPDQTYDSIEELYDVDAYLEMFARQSWTDRWDVWGLETDKFEPDICGPSTPVS